jgi:N,N'-diacetyllegionaminate synthase
MSDRTIIIAEAGVNHNGSMETAKKLIEVAAAAGADYVKFQTFKAGNLVTMNAPQAEYQKKNAGDGDFQYGMLKKLELSPEMHLELMDCCKNQGIKFLSTGFDLESIDFLDRLDVDFFKVPSGEITNKPYLIHVAKKGRPVIISTGMASLPEVKDALDLLADYGVKKEDITVLHCTTAYPTPMEEVNLRAMLSMQRELGVKTGYSDHTLGIEVPIAAVALGARIIEKHFTLDRNMPGPDHKASLEPDELKAMVAAIRNVEKATSGSGAKEPGPSELKNIMVARKSIVAACSIGKGEIFSLHNLATKRPGSGISPMLWDEVIGKKAKRSFQADEPIEL